MKKILIGLTLVTLITACGGSDSAKAIDEPTMPPVVTPPVTETKAEIVTRLNLPPEITIDEANSSIIGPDVNENQVRDDLERMVGFAAPADNEGDRKTRAAYYKWAQLWTQMINNQDDKEKLIELDYELDLLSSCFFEEIILEKNDLKGFEFDFINGSMEKAIVYDKINEHISIDRGIIPKQTYEPYCDKL